MTSAGPSPEGAWRKRVATAASKRRTRRCWCCDQEADLASPRRAIGLPTCWSSASDVDGLRVGACGWRPDARWQRPIACPGRGRGGNPRRTLSRSSGLARPHVGHPTLAGCSRRWTTRQLDPHHLRHWPPPCGWHVCKAVTSSLRRPAAERPRGARMARPRFGAARTAGLRNLARRQWSMSDRASRAASRSSWTRSSAVLRLRPAPRLRRSLERCNRIVEEQRIHGAQVTATSSLEHARRRQMDRRRPLQGPVDLPSGRTATSAARSNALQA